MDSAAATHPFDPISPFRDDLRGPRRPSQLTMSTMSSGIHTPEPSPTRSRQLDSGETVEEDNGPFVFIGPEKKRFHKNRKQAPYPLPCGLEELSR
jgi:hypothetical protein